MLWIYEPHENEEKWENVNDVSLGFNWNFIMSFCYYLIRNGNLRKNNLTLAKNFQLFIKFLNFLHLDYFESQFCNFFTKLHTNLFYFGFIVRLTLCHLNSLRIPKEQRRLDTLIFLKKSHIIFYALWAQKKDISNIINQQNICGCFVSKNF